MQPKPAFLAACVLTALIATQASPASALSCAVPELLVPRPDAVDVPTNTLLWCSSRSGEESAVIHLVDAGGADVRGTQTLLSVPDFELLVFRPDFELTADSVYHVECPGVSFTTGAGVRSTPPAVPKVSNVEFLTEREQTWGSSYFAHFQQVSEPDSIVVLDLAGRAALQPSEPSGLAADARLVPPNADFWVGHGPCGGNWREAGLGASTTVALGAFDLTGAFSGWTETVPVTLPNHFTSGENGGCQLGTLGRSPWGAAPALAALASILLRRKSR